MSWLTSRDILRRIAKPTYTTDMEFVQGLTLADLLWADPVLGQKKWFAPSHRRCGYTFNQKALKAVLRALKVKTLIRAHEYYASGSVRNFDDQSCYTRSSGIVWVYI
ncbi:unnamed protein product, partial [Gongylonema pulchrum]|uniref:protein-serine/threonine phosphatase n=1 Tax=Gongylonema pulchrum TaxID=637853 RepID=A0A183DAE7_9BILA